MNKKLLALLSLLTCGLIWGLTVPLLKANLETLPPFSLAAIRFTFAGLVAFIFAETSGLKLHDFVRIGKIAFFGISLHIGLLLLGLKETTAVDASLIYTLGPLITSLLAVVAIKERINLSHLLGIGLAFFGVSLYITYPLLFGSLHFKVSLLGDILVFGSTLAGSIYIVGSKKLFETYKPQAIAAVSFATGALTFVPLGLVESTIDPSWISEVSWFNLASILYFSLFSSFIAYSLYQWSLSKLPVHLEAAISYLTPVVSILAATIFLKEQLEPIFLFSCVFVVAGIYLVSRFKPSMHHHYHRHHHKV